MITLNPAKQLGIDKRTGSIEVGKDADIVIWTAHPFSVYSQTEMTMIEGETFFDRARHSKPRRMRKNAKRSKKWMSTRAGARRNFSRAFRAKNARRSRRSRFIGTEETEINENYELRITNYENLFLARVFVLLAVFTALLCCTVSRKATARSKRNGQKRELSPLPTRESSRFRARLSKTERSLFSNGKIAAVGANVSVPAARNELTAKV
jgi:hypothetical protein